MRAQGDDIGIGLRVDRLEVPATLAMSIKSSTFTVVATAPYGRFAIALKASAVVIYQNFCVTIAQATPPLKVTGAAVAL